MAIEEIIKEIIKDIDLVVSVSQTPQLVADDSLEIVPDEYRADLLEQIKRTAAAWIAERPECRKWLSDFVSENELTHEKWDTFKAANMFGLATISERALPANKREQWLAFVQRRTAEANAVRRSVRECEIAAAHERGRTEARELMMAAIAELETRETPPAPAIPLFDRAAVAE